MRQQPTSSFRRKPESILAFCSLRRRRKRQKQSKIKMGPGFRRDDEKKRATTRVPILVVAEGFALRCCDTSAHWRAMRVCAAVSRAGLRGNPENVTEIARNRDYGEPARVSVNMPTSVSSVPISDK